MVSHSPNTFQHSGKNRKCIPEYSATGGGHREDVTTVDTSTRVRQSNPPYPGSFSWVYTLHTVPSQESLQGRGLERLMC